MNLTKKRARMGNKEAIGLFSIVILAGLLSAIDWVEVGEGITGLAIFEVGTPYEGNVEISGCKTDWRCSRWSTCLDGKQKRNCDDYAECLTTQGRPDVERVCPELVVVEELEDVKPDLKETVVVEDEVKDAVKNEVNDELPAPTQTEASTEEKKEEGDGAAAGQAWFSQNVDVYAERQYAEEGRGKIEDVEKKGPPINRNLILSLAGLVMVIVVAGVFIINTRKKLKQNMPKQHKKPEEKEDNIVKQNIPVPANEIEQYAYDCIKQGFSEEEIREALVVQGWNREVADSAIMKFI